jgi:hypothetical protein
MNTGKQTPKRRDAYHPDLKEGQPMPQRRPYSALGSEDLVKELFNAAFEQDAAKYEDLRFEIEEGGKESKGRSKLANIKKAIFEAAQRVFDRDA